MNHRPPRPAGLAHLGVLGLAAVVLLAGCAMPMDARRDKAFQSHAHVADRPNNRPVRSVSSFSESLACMDRMLRAAELPTTLVTSKQIPDYSGKMPVATKDMIITALSQMSRTSNAFRYVDYEVELARQDTVQTLTTILLNNNQLQLQRPGLYFSGAISYLDQNVLSGHADFGTSASRLETGYSRSRNAALVALELHLGDFRTRTLIPGLDSANEVIIGTGGEGLDLAGRIGSYGVQFTIGRDYTQGAGAAMRTLVELATIELVGKWARVPYWQCLTLDQAHPEFQRTMRDWYEEGAAQTRSALVQQSLVMQGYLPAQAQPLPPQSRQLREALARFQTDRGMPASGELDFPTYEKALGGFVGLDAQGHLARIGWAPTSSTPLPVPPASEVASAYPVRPLGSPPEPRRIDMQIENVMTGRDAFEAGEQIFLSATVSRASFLYCYMWEERGVVMRLTPNDVNSASAVPAGIAARLPDWMSPSPAFVLDGGGPGRQGVVCYATEDEVTDQLPEALRGPALEPIAGVRSAAAVDEAFTQALGAEGFGRAALQWTVAPPRPAAAAAPRR